MVRHEVKQKVEARVSNILDSVIYDLETKEFDSTDEMIEAVDEVMDDGTCSVYLCLDDHLSAIEEYGDDDGLFSFEDVTLCNLRSKLESFSSLAIDLAAKAEVKEAISELEDFLLDEDLDLSEHRVDDNNFGWARHYSEREASGAQVYEYRNVEGEVHVDIYEFSLAGKNLYFARYLKDDEVSDEEKRFEAT